MEADAATWLITGASRGLGRHLARAMLARGWRVIAVARDAERLAALAAEDHPGQLLPLPLDLGDAAAIRPAVLQALSVTGRLDGVINNAGIGRYEPFLAASESALCSQIQVNLTACIQICHAVLPTLCAQRRGHIVNIASDLARRPLANMAAYVASKHGLAGFSHSLLREFKSQGIKVSLVNPGIIDTDFGGAVEGQAPVASSLAPAALARLILEIIDQPGNVVVDELTVHPLAQDEY